MNGFERQGRRTGRSVRPEAEFLEGRRLLSVGPRLPSYVTNPPGAGVAARPNTPVLPFGSPTKTATFIDPSVHVYNGKHVVVGTKTYIGPYASLDSRAGFIKIGTGSAILDNARIESDPSKTSPTTSVLIGDSVQIGYGATVIGPSVIGAYGSAAHATGIGANATINGATIEAGAFVGPLATVGPGVVVPAGMYVLPGANITTTAQASDPALGFVREVTATDTSQLKSELANDAGLAAGYTNLYQGSSATGPLPGVGSPPYNGDLAAVLGTSAEPGSTYVSIEPASPVGPKFFDPRRNELVQGLFYNFRSRIVGAVEFNELPKAVASALSHSDSIRADQGQPIIIGSLGAVGNHVTINSPLGGTLTIGQNFVANDFAVIESGVNPTTGKGVNAVIGDNVTIGAAAVVSQSSIGSGSTIGAGSYIFGSTIPANTTIAPRTILIDNVNEGTVGG